jgi:hypothetical protein
MIWLRAHGAPGQATLIYKWNSVAEVIRDEKKKEVYFQEADHGSRAV